MTDENGKRQANRTHFAQEAVHSQELEGLSVGTATKDDIQGYVDGILTSDELVGRALNRYKKG